MNSTLIFQFKQSLFTQQGFEVEVRMDVYQIPNPEGLKFPEGYRFSWIAFDRYNPKNRVLFDCHPPKGPHFHVDDEKDGQSFVWVSLEASMDLFWEKVWLRFGEREGEETS